MNHITVAVLAFEACRWNQRGAKEQAAHDLFGVSPTRYALAVNRLLDDPEAFVLDPQTVNRLRRLRESRRRQRGLQPVA